MRGRVGVGTHHYAGSPFAGEGIGLGALMPTDGFLYISILMVAFGIGLVIYSLARGPRRTAPGYRDSAAESGYPDQYGLPDRAEGPGRRIMDAGRREFPPGEEAVAFELPAEEEVSAASGGAAASDPQDAAKPAAETGAKPAAEPAKEEKKQPSAPSGAVDAVLYLDNSGLVDYEGRSNVIDPTLERYARMKRVGAGSVEIAKEGLNFRYQKNLYRFDFIRISDIHFGENYCALSIKGSDTVRLFLFADGHEFINRLNRDYGEFYRKTF